MMIKNVNVGYFVHIPNFGRVMRMEDDERYPVVRWQGRNITIRPEVVVITEIPRRHPIAIYFDMHEAGLMNDNEYRGAMQFYGL